MSVYALMLEEDWQEMELNELGRQETARQIPGSKKSIMLYLAYSRPFREKRRLLLILNRGNLILASISMYWCHSLHGDLASWCILVSQSARSSGISVFTAVTVCTEIWHLGVYRCHSLHRGLASRCLLVSQSALRSDISVFTVATVCTEIWHLSVY